MHQLAENTLETFHIDNEALYDIFASGTSSELAGVGGATPRTSGSSDLRYLAVHMLPFSQLHCNV